MEYLEEKMKEGTASPAVPIEIAAGIGFGSDFVRRMGKNKEELPDKSELAQNIGDGATGTTGLAVKAAKEIKANNIDDDTIQKTADALNINENALIKIETLLEEAIGDMRRRNMALMYQGLSPEERENLQSPNYAIKNAAKLGLKTGAVGAATGAIGGGLIAGVPGAALGAAAAGAGAGLGSGIGQYINARTMQKMDPIQAKKDAREAKKYYGKYYGSELAKIVQNQGPKAYA